MIPADLRLRLVAAAVLAAASSQLHAPAAAAAALALAVAVALAARTPGALWRRALHVEGFVILLVVTLPFAVPGEAMLSVGPLSASAEGFARAGLLALKISASVIFILALLGPAEPIRLGAALHALRAPEGLVRMLVLTLRYLGLAREEARRLQDAMRLRGFRPRSNRHTWRTYGNLVGMLLVRALERGERIEEAMRCRGFVGRFPHAGFAPPPARDWAGFATLTLLAAAGLAADLAGLWPGGTA